MYVDIDIGRIQFKPDNTLWKAVVKQYIAVAGPECCQQHAVTYDAAINKNKHAATVAVMTSRQAKAALHHDAFMLKAEHTAIITEISTHDHRHTRAAGLMRLQAQALPAIQTQAKSSGRVSQSQGAHSFEDDRILGAVGAKKLAPRRHVKKKIVHADAGTAPRRRRLGLCGATAINGHPDAFVHT